MNAPVLHAVSWNLTQRCNLRCAHCYLDAGARMGEGDLSTKRCLDIVEQLASVNPHLLLILTGGEPLLRADLPQIARAAVGRGMTVVVGTNGTFLDSERAEALKDAGVSGIGISLDAASDPALHDELRGRPGSWDDAMRGLNVCKEAGLDFIVQTSVFRWNRHELPAVAELAASLGARSWNVYFLVCTGRGQELTDLDSDEYEEALWEVRALQRRLADRTLVAVRCAPQYKRIVAQDPDQSFAFHAYEQGCPAATSYVRIDHKGRVTPCPYMPDHVGEIGPQPFAEIWETAPLLAALRDRSLLQGRCGMCSYRETCGGCRARAAAVLGDPLAQDPACAWEDAATAKTEAAAVPEATFALPAECTMPWTEEAVGRLDRVPSFLRGLVIRRVEERAHEDRQQEVTAKLMKAVRASMQKGGPGVPLERSRPKPAEKAHEGLVVWSPEALERLSNSPDFVRPGIIKLMKLRAEQQGRSEISSEFLSEIRDESMMRVSKIMRRFGLDQLDPTAFDEARRRMAKKPEKLMVIDQIQEFLKNRPNGRNEPIREKFRSFLAAAGGPGILWMPDAEAALHRLDERLRPRVRNEAEAEVRRLKLQIVTAGHVANASHELMEEG